MNWNDWEVIWRRQELPIGAMAEVEKLKQTFAAKRRKTACAMLARDVSEAAAGVIVSTAFALLWWKMGAAGWPFGIAILLVLSISGVFVRERWRVRRGRIAADAPMLAKVGADLAELRYQRRLTLAVRTWYLAPLAIAVLIVLVTLYVHQKPWERQPVFMGVFVIFYALLNWLAWTINRRAVRDRLDPRIEEFEKLHRALISPAGE
jgi:hypothetical protein